MFVVNNGLSDNKTCTKYERGGSEVVFEGTERFLQSEIVHTPENNSLMLTIGEYEESHCENIAPIDRFQQQEFEVDITLYVNYHFNVEKFSDTLAVSVPHNANLEWRPLN